MSCRGRAVRFGFDLALGDGFLVVSAPLEAGVATGIHETPRSSAGAPNSGGLYFLE